MNLLAYHITWGTYGTRLHGDPRPTVDRQHNVYGEPVLEFDEHRWEREKALLKYPPVIFARPQMMLVESLLPEICARGGWEHRAGACGPDHVHEVLFSRNDPETIRRLFKRWLGQTLTQRLKGEPGCPQPATDQTWWAECGSIRWIFEEDGDYYERAIRYLGQQRSRRRSCLLFRRILATFVPWGRWHICFNNFGPCPISVTDFFDEL